jgi:hypothetical protein
MPEIHSTIVTKVKIQQSKKFSKMSKTMQVSRKRARNPALYWDVSKIVWDYLIEDADEAILYKQSLRPWQKSCCESVISFLLKPLQKFLRNHEAMTTNWGCATACLLSPCPTCYYARPIELTGMAVSHRSMNQFIHYVYQRYTQLGLLVGYNGEEIAITRTRQIQRMRMEARIVLGEARARVNRLVGHPVWNDSMIA